MIQFFKNLFNPPTEPKDKIYDSDYDPLRELMNKLDRREKAAESPQNAKEQIFQFLCKIAERPRDFEGTLGYRYKHPSGFVFITIGNKIEYKEERFTILSHYEDQKIFDIFHKNLRNEQQNEILNFLNR